MLKKSTILIPALLMIALSGCSSTLRLFKTQSYLNTDLIEASYDATEELKDNLTRKMPKDTLIVVSTLLNVKNLKETSSFGRIISNQIATNLQKSGYQIIGMDLPADLFMMKENGEIKLSDEDQALLRKYKSVILVGGVYAPGKQTAYVTLRAVDRYTKQAIASTDFSVVLGPDVKTLLKTKDTGVVIGSAGSLPPSTVEEVVPAGKGDVSGVESLSPNLRAVPANTLPDTESAPPKFDAVPPNADPAVEGEEQQPAVDGVKPPVDSIN